jgi:hypothetical protein
MERSDQRFDQAKETKEIINALKGLLAGDEQEQRETFTFLKQALDEDRLSRRKLFTPA